MAKTPSAAIKWSLATKAGYGGMCLKFVRTAYGIGAQYGSAKVAWANAKYKHFSLKGAPKGAFVFLSHPKSKYGHVAIYLGDGKMRTTNSVTNRIHTDKISLWESWGYTVQGWTEDINGVRVSELKVARIKAPAKVYLKRGDTGAKVRSLQRGLATKFPAYRNVAGVRQGQGLDIDGSFGPQLEAWVRVFQGRSGLTRSGKVNSATKKALAKYGIKV